VIVIIAIVFGVTSSSRECHGLKPVTDESTAVKSRNNH